MTESIADRRETTLADSNAAAPALKGASGSPPAGMAGNAVRRQALLLTLACAVTGLLLAVLAVADRAATRDWTTHAARAAGLAADAQAIARLRALPQQATETGLARADLLARVAEAMRVAQLPAESLVSTQPQPPRKVPGSPHAEVSYRLLFENVALEPLVRFSRQLTAEDAALRVTGLQLRAGNDRRTWQADLTVSNWVLAPAAGP